MPSYYYSGQGSLYTADRDAQGRPMGFEELGNVPSLELSIEITKFEHKESQSGQRAIDLTIVQEKKGTFTMTVESLTMANLADAFWGQSAVTAAGTGVANNDVMAYLDKRCPLGYANVSNVVVKDSTEVTTYVENTDYTIDAVNGIIIPTGGGAITDGENLHVTLDHGGFSKMDAFTKTSLEKYLRFEGLNTIDNKTVIVDIFKASIDPLTGFGLINEELGSFDLSGTILFDALQAGDSKFFSQTYVD